MSDRNADSHADKNADRNKNEDRNGLTDQLLCFTKKLSFEDLPSSVIEIQKKSLLDSIGVMSAATTLESACQPFIDLAAEESGPSVCSMMGTGEQASPVFAAMANGALIHALDYEDGHDRSKTHPNTASIPVLMALSEAYGPVDGKSFLTAMALGSELACRLKMALTADDLGSGWYSPAMFSAYGAAFAGAKILGFSEESTLDALSLCMTQIMVSGQAARSGDSCLRAVRDAFSAKAAILSILLAKKGARGRVSEPFEGPLGLYYMMTRGSYDPSVILDGLGKTWICSDLRYKYWPCCGTTHGGIYALLQILEEYHPSPDEIREIHLVIDPVHLRVLAPYDAKYRPKTIAAARFSMPFCLSLAVLFGDVRLHMFSEENLYSQKIMELAQKVTYEIRPGGADGLLDDHIQVILHTSHAVYKKEVFATPGSPKMPLTKEQIQNKFTDCMHFARIRVSEQRAGHIQEMISRFEELKDTGAFFREVNRLEDIR